MSSLVGLTPIPLRCFQRGSGSIPLIGCGLRYNRYTLVFLLILYEFNGCHSASGRAGNGMKSGLPKVMHALGGKPLFLYCWQLPSDFGPVRLLIVIGYGAETVKRAYGNGDVAGSSRSSNSARAMRYFAPKTAFEDFPAIFYS